MLMSLVAFERTRDYMRDFVPSKCCDFIDECFWGFGDMLILALLENSKLCFVDISLMQSSVLRWENHPLFGFSWFLLVSQVYDLTILMICEITLQQAELFVCVWKVVKDIITQDSGNIWYFMRENVNIWYIWWFHFICVKTEANVCIWGE